MLANVRTANKIMYIIQTGIVLIGLLVSLSGFFGLSVIYQEEVPRESLLVQLSIVLSFVLLLVCCLQGTKLKRTFFGMAVICCILTLCGLLFITPKDTTAQALILIAAILLLLLFFFLQRMTIAALSLLFIVCNLSVAWAVLETVDVAKSADVALASGMEGQIAVHTLLNIWSGPILSTSLLIVYFMLSHMQGGILTDTTVKTQQEAEKNA